MGKSEYFNRLLRITSEETEIPVARIMGKSQDMETTDARYIMVVLLYERGFYPDQIAVLLSYTPRGIRKLRTRNLTSPMIRINLEHIRDRLGTE